MSTMRRSSWVPKTTVTDKIGYAINPGGHPELASGFISGVSADSKNKDAAYLYIQWMHSKDQSLKNVMRPVGLRDPFRISHYASPDYQALWPTAPEYLKVLKDGAAAGYADFSLIETFKYQDAMSRAVIAAIGGDGPQGGARRHGGRVGSADRAGRRRQAACGLRGLGCQAVRLSPVSSTAAHLGHRPARRVGRRPGPGFWFVAPAVFMLILIGLLPFVWSVVVSFQNLAGANRAGSFVGFANYLKLWHDARLWAALGRTFAIMAVALPLQLVLGLLLALHFQSDRPLKKLFVAAAGAAGGHLAHGGGLDVAADVRPEVRAVEPDHLAGSPRSRWCCCGSSSRRCHSGRSSSPKSGSGRRSCS